jgi:hypothetical protein
MTSNILKEIKEFVWKDVPNLKWGLAVRSAAEGGIGVRDPGALIDGMRISLLKELQMKADQPWTKWLRRKENRLSRRWAVKNVYQGDVPKKKLKELKETCVFESAIRVWHELGGTVIRQKGEDVKVLKIKDVQIDLEGTRNRMIYDELIRLRFGDLKEKEKKVNHAMTTIKEKLTPQQRQFWWRVAHKKYQTNNQAHKWKVDASGRAASQCSVCKGPKEDWAHMEYECDGIQKWIKQLGALYEKFTRGKDVQRWKKPDRAEWRLEEGKDMEEDKMIVIAIARWLYHKERSALVHRQRRRLDIDRLTERAEEELMSIRKKEREGREVEKEEKEKKEEKREE